MKRLMIPLLLLSCQPAMAGNWVDGWFDNAVYDKPTSYESQKRGFYSAGGFSARFNSTTDYPISVSAPKLSVGCGGIDAFLGGVSFLDADFLVEKTQRIMQAAPFVALDMAMKTMCKECSDTLAKAEQIANFLNGIQLNECQMAKPIATAIVDRNPEALKGLWTEATGTKDLNEAKTRMWGESTDDIKANNNSPTTDLKPLTDGCPSEFRNLMVNGSLVGKMASLTGMAEYTDVLRGYIGDVYLYAGATDKIPHAKKIPHCQENDDMQIDDLLYGRTYQKNASGVCSLSTGGSVYGVVNTKLVSIANKLKTGQALSSDEESFVFASSNLPVYTLLMQSIYDDTVDDMVIVLTDLVAVHYSYMIFNDLYRNMEYSMTVVANAMTPTTNDPSAGNKQCRADLYLPVTSKFNDLVDNTRGKQKTLLTSYHARLSQITNNQQFVSQYERRALRYRESQSVTSLQGVQ